MKIKSNLGFKEGIVIANPINLEFSIEERLLENAIYIALKEVTEKNITREAITSFSIERVNFLTNGKSLKSNISLISNNARIAAKI